MFSDEAMIKSQKEDVYFYIYSFSRLFYPNEEENYDPKETKTLEKTLYSVKSREGKAM